MNKNTARLIAQSRITIGDVIDLLLAVREQPDIFFEKRSRLNKGLSRGVVFNIFWKAYKNRSREIIVETDDIVPVTNLLREFGDFWKGGKPEKQRLSRPLTFSHQPIDRTPIE